VTEEQGKEAVVGHLGVVGCILFRASYWSCGTRQWKEQREDWDEAEAMMIDQIGAAIDASRDHSPDGSSLSEKAGEMLRQMSGLRADMHMNPPLLALRQAVIVEMARLAQVISKIGV